MGQQINRLNITLFQISHYKTFERLVKFPHSPRLLVRSMSTCNTWREHVELVSHAVRTVIVRYGAQLCARVRPSMGMFNCHFMFVNLCVLFRKCLKSVELVLLCMFQTILSVGNCNWPEWGVSVCVSAEISLVSMLLIQLTLPASFSSKFGFFFAKILGLC